MKPEQYKMNIDTFDRIRANANKDEWVGFCRYNIDKYTHRKKGTDEEDLLKIKDYVGFWLEALRRFK